MKICFVTDGGRQYGMGHVQESSAFAQRFQDKAEIVFLTKSGDAVLAAIRASGFDAENS